MRRLTEDGAQDFQLKYLRERDRAIGLEQQLRRLNSGALEQEAASKVSRIENSVEYKLGRALTSPLRLGKKIIGKLYRSMRKLVKTSRKIDNKT